jgi:NAD(P)-dependent dehydrogenase (short-subunit alcohol dehydrogenase family)
MAGLLEGKCAVITGAGRGQGREIALAMAARDVRVVVNDLGGEKDGTGADRAPADEVVAEIRKAGGTAVASYDSVADFAGAERIVNTCVGSFGRIDILVNCAGIGGPRPFHFWEMKKEEWDVVIDVNLGGTFNMCRHALAQMVKQDYGRIINFSSPAWLGNGASPYTASKGGVVSLTVGIAQIMEAEGRHITCNALVPIAETRMSPRRGNWKQLYDLGLITKQIYEESSDPPPPEHIPAAVMYLATDDAASINGQVIGASRGRVALYSWPTEVAGIYKDGVWTLEELVKLVPGTLTRQMKRARG